MLTVDIFIYILIFPHWYPHGFSGSCWRVVIRLYSPKERQQENLLPSGAGHDSIFIFLPRIGSRSSFLFHLFIISEILSDQIFWLKSNLLFPIQFSSCPIFSFLSNFLVKIQLDQIVRLNCLESNHLAIYDPNQYFFSSVHHPNN